MRILLFLEFGYVFLEGIDANRFLIQAIVSFMQSNTVVIYLTGKTDLLAKMLVFLGVI